MNLRGAKPVNDNSVKSFINGIDSSRFLYSDDVHQEFTDRYFDWLNSSKLNKIEGLENFKNRKLVAGTIQAFDHFYLRHYRRRFRFFKGEFMYHSACLKQNIDWSWLDDRNIEDNDAVIVSVPFSDWGTQRDINDILEQCNDLQVPVLLDFAYFPCTKNIEINLDDFPCVETVAFSISKAFYGGEFLRVGMRLQREDWDDGVDVFNSVDMINRISVGIANELIKKYSVDHNWDTYSDDYFSVCKELNLEPTDCIMFGLGDKEYADFNRGTDVNRVCISELIGERVNGSS